MATLLPLVDASEVETIVLLTVASRSATEALSISFVEPGR